MRNEEVDFLYEMVEQTEGDILEIGMGGSTFAFLDATKDTDRQVWSIDMKNKLEKFIPYVHLGLTSEDVNSLSYAQMIREIKMKPLFQLTL